MAQLNETKILDGLTNSGIAPSLKKLIMELVTAINGKQDVEVK